MSPSSNQPNTIEKLSNTDKDQANTIEWLLNTVKDQGNTITGLSNTVEILSASNRVLQAKTTAYQDSFYRLRADFDMEFPARKRRHVEEHVEEDGEILADEHGEEHDQQHDQQHDEQHDQQHNEQHNEQHGEEHDEEHDDEHGGPLNTFLEGIQEYAEPAPRKKMGRPPKRRTAKKVDRKHVIAVDGEIRSLDGLSRTTRTRLLTSLDTLLGNKKGRQSRRTRYDGLVRNATTHVDECLLDGIMGRGGRNTLGEELVACTPCVANSRPCVQIRIVDGEHVLCFAPLPEEERVSDNWNDIKNWIK